MVNLIGSTETKFRLVSGGPYFCLASLFLFWAIRSLRLNISDDYICQLHD